MFLDQLSKEVLEIELNQDKQFIVVEKSPKNRFEKFNEIIQENQFVTTFKAYDAHSGREATWNVFNMSKATIGQTSSFIKAIKNMKTLKHENVVEYIDSWINKQKKEFVFVLELMNGGTLKHHLKKIIRPKLNIIKQWCTDILHTILFIQENREDIMINLKCRNIYINSNTNQIKLGYQCFLPNQIQLISDSSTTKSNLDIAWMPFQATHYQKNVDQFPWCNIYEFGLTLLQIVTGKEPYCECKNDLEVAKNIVWKIKPAYINRVGHSQIKGIINSCVTSKKQRISLKQLILLEFWKIDPTDNVYVEIEKLKQNKESQNKSSNLELTRTGLLSTKPSNNSSRKIVQSQYQALFNYKTQTNKNFQIKIISLENERIDFQDFVLYFINRIQGRQTKILKANESIHPQQISPIVKNIKNIFVKKYKQYSAEIQTFIAETLTLETILQQKIQMQQKQIILFQKEFEVKLTEKINKNKKNQFFGLDLFDVINFNLNTLETKQTKKGQYNDLFNFSYSSIHPQNKSQKSQQDSDLDFEKMSEIHDAKNRTQLQDDNYQSNSVCNFVQKLKYNRSQKIESKHHIDSQKQ